MKSINQDCVALIHVYWHPKTATRLDVSKAVQPGSDHANGVGGEIGGYIIAPYHRAENCDRTRDFVIRKL